MVWLRASYLIISHSVCWRLQCLQKTTLTGGAFIVVLHGFDECFCLCRSDRRDGIHGKINVGDEGLLWTESYLICSSYTVDCLLLLQELLPYFYFHNLQDLSL